MKHSHFILITAVVATVVAAVLYTAMVGNSLSDDPVISLFGTVLATFSVAALCWWAFISRPKRPTVARGGVTGLLISILAFPVAFAITLLVSLIREGLPDMGATDYLIYIFGLGALSVAVVGIFTIPIGVVGGAILAYIQRRTVRENP